MPQRECSGEREELNSPPPLSYHTSPIARRNFCAGFPYIGSELGEGQIPFKNEKKHGKCQGGGKWEV